MGVILLETMKLKMVIVNKLNIVHKNRSRKKEAGIRKYYRAIAVYFISLYRLNAVCLLSICREVSVKLPSISYLFITCLPFNTRLNSVMLPFCSRDAAVPVSSNKKNYNRIISALPVIKRMFESNQFNNLSPPYQALALP